jgi:hypothetical protein
MELETYILPAHWAPALVNGDYSGLFDDDDIAIDSWFAATFPHGALCVDVSDSGEDFRRYHDASAYALACNCAEYTFDVTGVPA